MVWKFKMTKVCVKCKKKLEKMRIVNQAGMLNGIYTIVLYCINDECDMFGVLTMAAREEITL